MKESEEKKNSMAKRMVGNEVNQPRPYSEKMKGVSNLEQLRKKK